MASGAFIAPSYGSRPRRPGCRRSGRGVQWASRYSIELRSAGAPARATALDRRPLRSLGEGLDRLRLDAAGSTEVLAQAGERQAHEVALRQFGLARRGLQPRD